MNTTTEVTWNRLRVMVKNRDKSICYHCKTFTGAGHCDHLIPISKGGTDAIENLVWSCPKCNLRKGNKILPQTQKLSQVIRPLWGNVAPAFWTSFVSAIVAPYPEYTELDYPNWETYFDWIVFLRSLKITDWLRRRLWITPLAAQNVIDAQDAADRLMKRMLRYHIVKDVNILLNKIVCPECGCQVKLSEPANSEVHYLCPAGHDGTYAIITTGETVRDFNKAARKWAAWQSGLIPQPYPFEAPGPAPLMK